MVCDGLDKTPHQRAGDSASGRCQLRSLPGASHAQHTSYHALIAGEEIDQEQQFLACLFDSFCIAREQRLVVLGYCLPVESGQDQITLQIPCTYGIVMILRQQLPSVGGTTAAHPSV